MKRRAFGEGSTEPPPAPLTLGAAYLKAVSRLARRDRSEHEIRTGLLRDGFPEPIIEATLERLRRERALDDSGYAARFARSRMRFNGLGRNRIRQDLRVRGIPRTVAEAGLQEALADVSEGDAIETLSRRYWKAHVADEPRKRLRKLWAFLLRRGFPFPAVQESLKRLWPRWSDALDGLEPVDDDAAALGRPHEEKE